jgi:hypothetical protein
MSGSERQFLNTISPSIIAANYQIKGLWIGIDGSDNSGHTGLARDENEDRIYLPLEKAA